MEEALPVAQMTIRQLLQGRRGEKGASSDDQGERLRRGGIRIQQHPPSGAPSGCKRRHVGLRSRQPLPISDPFAD
jgi:hypothetical protein